jgi:hypothetical protein
MRIFRPGDKFVIFIIGEDNKEILVHKSFACHYTPTFKAAFTNPAWKEYATQTYELKDITPGTFSLLVQWLYTQKLDYDNGSNGVTGPDLVRLWVLADRLLLPRLQNAAMNLVEVILMTKNIIPIPLHMLSYIYKNTLDDIPLRRFFVDVCASNLRDSHFLEKSNEFPHRMLIDLAIALKAKMTKSGYKAGVRNMAEFHVAEDK